MKPRNRSLLRTTWARLGIAIVCISVVAFATPGAGRLFNFVFSAAVVGGNVQVERDVPTAQWEIALHTTGKTDVITQVAILAPGGYTGWHNHPGPQVLSVTDGTATIYHGDDPTCTGQVIATGGAHIDDGSVVRNMRNEGTTNLTVYATYLVPHGTLSPRIDQPAPGNCPF
jgi:mannose-6-phosphate isomerase-like protein (cupin superfamily)